MIYEYMDKKAEEYRAFDRGRVRRLYTLLKPHIPLQSYNIHIIGTNGKGSTGRFLAQSMIESRHKVLHFTSPHVFDFRERFYTNDGIIKLEELNKAHNFLQQFPFIQEASYFEYATFLALVLARECAFLVMEAGVGGEFDSTSVLRYDMTIFTRIGLDHKEMLGEDLESIARTKLRAAQGVIFTHFQESETRYFLENLGGILPLREDYEAQGKNYPLLDSIICLQKSDITQEAIQEYSNTYKIPYFLQENLALAFLCLQHLGIPLLRERLRLRGRFEVLQKNIVLDVGHNIMAARAALEAAKTYFQNKPFTLIYNSYKEKEVQEILKIFANEISEVIIFMVDNPRIMQQRDMENILQDLSLSYSFFCPDSLKLDLLPKNLIESDFFVKDEINYLVFGSFSLVEHFLLWFDRRAGKLR